MFLPFWMWKPELRTRGPLKGFAEKKLDQSF